jgi:hypothetical protein
MLISCELRVAVGSGGSGRSTGAWAKDAGMDIQVYARGISELFVGRSVGQIMTMAGARHDSIEAA